MALATQGDVEADLGRDLLEPEVARAGSLLTKASAVVIGWCGQDFEPAPYPPVVTAVVAGMVSRLLSVPAEAAFATQQSAGPFSRSFNPVATTGDVYMTKADKLALRSYRLGGGLTSVPLQSAAYDPPEA